MPDNVRSEADALLRSNRRIPEEVLGPQDLFNLWGEGSADLLPKSTFEKPRSGTETRNG